MGPVSASIEIDVPREQAFELIGDLARRPAFCDHFMEDFRLTRIESSGVGAGARFRFARLLHSVWMDTTIAEVDFPHRIVEHGRGGRGNRIPSTTVWELVAGAGSLTKVRVSHWTEPSNRVDRAIEKLTGATLWHERAWREALRRLRGVLEDGAAAGAAVAVAGGNRHATGVP